MYKSGKSWVVKSTLSFMGGLVLFGVSQSTVVKADDTAGAVSQATAEVSTTQGQNAGSTVAKTDVGVEDDTGKSGNVTTADKTTQQSNTGNVAQNTGTTGSTTKNPQQGNGILTAQGSQNEGSGENTGTDNQTELKQNSKQIANEQNKSGTQQQLPIAVSADVSDSTIQNENPHGDNWTFSYIAGNVGKISISGGDLSTKNNNDPWSGLTDEEKNIVKEIDFDKNNVTTADTDISGLFSDFGYLQGIYGLEYLNTSKTTNMSSLFKNSDKLGTIDGLNKLDVSNVTDFSDMFLSDTSMSSIDISDWNWASGEDFSNMFATGTDYTSEATQESIILPTNPSKSASNLSGMFENDKTLKNIENLDKLDVTNVTDFSNMFLLDSALQSIDISDWNWISGKNFSNMFSTGDVEGDKIVSSLTNITLPTVGSDSATNLSNMFKYDQNLTDINNLNKMNVTNVIDFSYMFLDDSSLPSIDISSWNWVNGKDFSLMFVTTNDDGAKTALKEIKMPTAIAGEKVSDKNNISFYEMFDNDKGLTSLDISMLDMSQSANGMDRYLLSGSDNISKIKLSSQNRLINSGLSFYNTENISNKDKNLPAVVAWEVVSPTGEISETKTNEELVNMYDGTTNNGGAKTWVWDKESPMDLKVNYVAADDNSKILGYETINDYPNSSYLTKSLEELAQVPNGHVDNYDGYQGEFETSITLRKDGNNDVQVPRAAVMYEVVAKHTNGKDIIGYKTFNITSKDSLDDSQLNDLFKSKEMVLSDTDGSYIDIYDPMGNLATGSGHFANISSSWISENLLNGDSADNVKTVSDLLPLLMKYYGSGMIPDGYKFVINAVYDNVPDKTTDPGSGTTTGGNTSSGSSSSSSHHSSSNNSSDNSTDTPEVSHSVESIKETIGTNGDISDVQLYDDNGNPVTDRTLAPSSDWYTDNLMTLDGVDYYRVATDLWAKAENVYVYHPINSKVLVDKGKLAKLVTSQGKPVTDRELKSNSGWYTDRYIYINKAKYYRVSTNEFVSADDVEEY